MECEILGALWITTSDMAFLYHANQVSKYGGKPFTDPWALKSPFACVALSCLRPQRPSEELPECGSDKCCCVKLSYKSAPRARVAHPVTWFRPFVAWIPTPWCTWTVFLLLKSLQYCRKLWICVILPWAGVFDCKYGKVITLKEIDLRKR